MLAAADQHDGPARRFNKAGADRLLELDRLAAADIETTLVANLSRDLHSLFDPVSEDVLPIYFGPLLGRLYLNDL